MRNFFKNIFCFFLIFFILDKGFYYFLDKAPKLEYDTRLEKIINSQMNKDIIILGSSRGSDNILAGEIENKTGMLTYNLSYQGANVCFQYFILNSLLEFNIKPKKVILSIDNPYEFDNEKSLIFRIDRLTPLSKYNYISNELINQKEQNILSKLFCLSRLNKDQINFNQKKKTSIIPIDSYGSMPLLNKKDTTILNFNNEKYLYNKNQESKEKLKAFKQIQKLCKNNGIDLFYVFSPNYGNFNNGFYHRFVNEVDVKKIIVYDSLNPIYKNADYYYDESHLLEKGAEIFTQEIITSIKSK